MYSTDKIGIIADDLTGANDTALQFFLRGCETKILLDYQDCIDSADVLAVPTESRNVGQEEAIEKVSTVAKTFSGMGVDKIYKKIDSTLRGHIALEAMTVVEECGYDGAVVLPAFPVEGRTTVGGFHLLKGVPIQRTELARDVHSPVYDSHIPTILIKQLKPEDAGIVGSISLDVVMKGAGPILMALNEQIKQGKKLIVIDAVSVVDIEQVVLAISKTTYKVLPCGSAGLAQFLANVWLPEIEQQEQSLTVPKLPRLIVSGSATDLTTLQIKKLHESIDIENLYSISINAEDILTNNVSGIAQKALPNLIKNNTVLIHSSDIKTSSEEFVQYLFEKEISANDFISKISQYLAYVACEILEQKEAILITVGGETSYKCAKTIDCKNLKVIDAINPAIPLCVDNKNRFIVTKSGNLGTSSTLIEILNYFEEND